MSELGRLGSDDPIAGALFEAARSYRPPVRLRRGTMRALGIPVGLSLIGSALAHGAQAAAPFKGWIVAGALTAATAGGGALYVSHRLAAPERPVVVEAPRPLVARPRPPAPSALAEVAPTAAAPAPALSRTRARTRAPENLRDSEYEHEYEYEHQMGRRPVASPTSPPPSIIEPPPVAALPPRPTGPAPLPRPMLPPPPPSPRSTLDAELAVIETARAQLAANPRGALATLDGYGRAHPRGLLGEEAEILRLSALTAAGAHQEAAARAAAFLSAHPASPLAARARTFLTNHPAQ